MSFFETMIEDRRFFFSSSETQNNSQSGKKSVSVFSMASHNIFSSSWCSVHCMYVGMTAVGPVLSMPYELLPVEFVFAVSCLVGVLTLARATSLFHSSSTYIVLSVDGCYDRGIPLRLKRTSF